MEDPREALLRIDAKAKANPIFVGNAYKSSEPEKKLHGSTFEQEQADFKHGQRKFR